MPEIKNEFPKGFAANIETVFLVENADIREELVSELFRMQNQVYEAKMAEHTIGFATGYGVAAGSMLGMIGGATIGLVDNQNANLWVATGMSLGSMAGGAAGLAADVFNHIHNQQLKQYIFDRTRTFSNMVWDHLDESARNYVNTWADRLRKK